MHELSIAQSLIDIVSRQCIEKGFKEVESIDVSIGRASGILPDALLFAFDVIKSDSIAKSAKLNITEVPVSGQCRICGNTFVTEEEYVLCCPCCGGTHFFVTGGRELDVTEMEVS